VLKHPEHEENDMTNFAAQRTAQRTAQRGFTLIELMATVSIAGVLSSVALPSFEGVLHKARRSDALVAAAQVQLAQEAYRSLANSYGTLADVRVPSRSPAGHYALEVGALSAAGYEIVATAVGAQARDAACRFLKLTSRGLDVERASGPDANVANDAATNRRCWTL
jgi:type IV pilus assembly protein PilE